MAKFSSISRNKKKSKRDAWRMISELKKDKCLILTTHSMEEADALADKIYIMADGNVVSTGNSVQLKKFIPYLFPEEKKLDWLLFIEPCKR
jgi:ABC-type multidrug transport system ATPase subunit